MSDPRDIPPGKARWKIQTKSRDESTILVVPYADARDVATIMDDLYGPLGWGDKYRVEQVGNNTAVVCTITIYVHRIGDEGYEIHKEGMAEPSQIEPVKGAESDAFKRAAVKLGIGRNLYALPAVWITAKKDRNGRAAMPDNAPKLIEAKLRQLGWDGWDVAHVDDTGTSAAGADTPASPRVATPPDAGRDRGEPDEGPAPPPEALLVEDPAEGTVPEIKARVRLLYQSMTEAGVWVPELLEEHLRGELEAQGKEPKRKPPGVPDVTFSDLGVKDDVQRFARHVWTAATRDLLDQTRQETTT